MSEMTGLYEHYHGVLEGFEDGDGIIRNVPSDDIAAMLVQDGPAPQLLKACRWFIRQFEGESGTGYTHWMQYPEFLEAKRVVEGLK